MCIHGIDDVRKHIVIDSEIKSIVHLNTIAIRGETEGYYYVLLEYIMNALINRYGTYYKLIHGDIIVQRTRRYRLK